ncbi:MAG TPA: undecaprenyl-diphosphate phosphatase [Terracidiphilus sp.]|nr:undecaprenyl-diphosphate phosphatase [Terracidiphilus sp.]
MTILDVILLAIVQGLAELLPVSSSAHVVVAEKLMGLDPSSPRMTLLLVMLHTGTMFAVIAYFWPTWKRAYFSSAQAFRRFALLLIWATLLTGILGEILKKLIEKTMFKGAPKAEIELLFSRLDLIAPALAGAGLLILIAGILEKRRTTAMVPASPAADLQSGESISLAQAGWMGIVQGLALPFRGFSRSGSTISVGMLAGAAKERAERFSFAMAVVLTPPVVVIEALRLDRASLGHAGAFTAALGMSLLGMVFSFAAGLLALRWLSRWLETGRWYLFGVYCLCASVVVWYLHLKGF